VRRAVPPRTAAACVSAPDRDRSTSVPYRDGGVGPGGGDGPGRLRSTPRRGLPPPRCRLVAVRHHRGRLGVPAGAAPSKDWTVRTLPCASGHRSAVFAHSPTHPDWVASPHGDDGGVINPYGWRPSFSNPCKGQWVLSVWEGDPAPDSTLTISAQTGTAGRVTPGNGTMKALNVSHLAAAPYCPTDIGSDLATIVRLGPAAPLLSPATKKLPGAAG